LPIYGGAAKLYLVASLILFARSLVIFQPIVAGLLVVDFGADRRGALERFREGFKLVGRFEAGRQHSLHFIPMVLVEFLDPNNDVWHLRAILLRRHDGDEPAASVGHVDVPWCPGDDAVHTDVLGFSS